MEGEVELGGQQNPGLHNPEHDELKEIEFPYLPAGHGCIDIILGQKNPIGHVDGKEHDPLITEMVGRSEGMVDGVFPRFIASPNPNWP